ncbi:MAG: glycosyltransferase, partial [Bryobacteraceae bacterium]
GVEMILDAARSLAGQPIYFVICGEGVAEAPLKSAAAGASNIRFLPLRPANQLNALLNCADIHLLPQRRGAARSVFPSKLIGMLASGRPVVAMAEPGSEISDLIEGCGTCVEHGDVEGFANAIRSLAADKRARERMGEQARARALEGFNQQRVLTAMVAELLRRLPLSHSAKATAQAGLRRAPE